MSFSISAPNTRTSTGCRISISANITDSAFRRLSVTKGARLMRTSAIVLASLMAALPAFGQPTPTRSIGAHRGEEKSLSCDNRSFNQNKMVTHCEMREQTLGFAGRLAVDPGMNGGVTVKGWDRADVLVRAKV